MNKSHYITWLHWTQNLQVNTNCFNWDDNLCHILFLWICCIQFIDNILARENILLWFSFFIQSVREDGELQVWQMETGKLISSMPIGLQVSIINVILNLLTLTYIIQQLVLNYIKLLNTQEIWQYMDYLAHEFSVRYLLEYQWVMFSIVL